MNIMQKANIEKGSSIFFSEYMTFLMRVNNEKKPNLQNLEKGGGGRRERKDEGSGAEEDRVCSRKSQSSDLSIES